MRRHRGRGRRRAGGPGVHRAVLLPLPEPLLRRAVVHVAAPGRVGARRQRRQHRDHRLGPPELRALHRALHQQRQRGAPQHHRALGSGAGEARPGDQPEHSRCADLLLLLLLLLLLPTRRHKERRYLRVQRRLRAHQRAQRCGELISEEVAARGGGRRALDTRARSDGRHGG